MMRLHYYVAMAMTLLIAPLAADTGPAIIPSVSTASQPALPVFKVKTGDEFIAALGSNRIIELAPGNYDFRNVERLNTRNFRFGLTAGSSETSLLIRHVENLTIECPAANPAQISANQHGIYALCLSDAAHIHLKNIELCNGHGESDAGGVLCLAECHDITLDHCTLTGCSPEAINATEVDGLIVKNSRILYSSDDIMTATEASHVQFIDSDLKNNLLTGPAFIIARSPSISFSGCTISGSTAAHAYETQSFISTADADCRLTFTSCTINDNIGPVFASGRGTVTVNDCKMEGNDFTVAQDKK